MPDFRKYKFGTDVVSKLIEVFHSLGTVVKRIKLYKELIANVI